MLSSMTIARAGSVLTLSAVCLLQGCKVTTPWGTAEPADPPRPNDNCMPADVGEREYRGRDYRLVDTDCDGEPDFAYDAERGRWYRLTGNNDPMIMSLSTGDQPELVKFDPLEGAFFCTHIELPGFKTELDFDLDSRSANEWIHHFGLDWTVGLGTDSLVPPFQLYELTVDTNTEEVEVSIPWTSTLPMPSFCDFDLQSEILGNYDDGGPAFFMVRVAGDGSEVLRFMHSLFEDDDLQVNAFFDTDAWRFESEWEPGFGGIAEVYRNGEFVTSWELE